MLAEDYLWLVFLGSAASNRALEVAKNLDHWTGAQTFSFSPQRDGAEQEPWALYSSDDADFKRVLKQKSKRSGHLEYVLISYLKSSFPPQVIIAFAGMTTAGTYAAVQYFSDDRKLESLLAELEIKPEDEIPAFEVVLRVDVFDGTFASFGVEAKKVHRSNGESGIVSDL